jgi:hypothetical protein
MGMTFELKKWRRIRCNHREYVHRHLDKKGMFGMDISESEMLELIEFEKVCRSNGEYRNCTFIRKFKKILPDLEVRYPKGSNEFYRGRIYKNTISERAVELSESISKAQTEEELKNIKTMSDEFYKSVIDSLHNGFLGYDEKDSFVPCDASKVKPGRCNREFEVVLYVADIPETCISELKPLIHEKISVAQVECLEELKLINLSFDFDDKGTYRDLYSLLFVTSPTEENKDVYLSTQALCGIVRDEGYDGISYSSCQNLKNTNYVIFNYNKCRTINSRIYMVDDIRYESTILSKL